MGFFVCFLKKKLLILRNLQGKFDIKETGNFQGKFDIPVKPVQLSRLLTLALEPSS